MELIAIFQLHYGRGFLAVCYMTSKSNPSPHWHNSAPLPKSSWTDTNKTTGEIYKSEPMSQLKCSKKFRQRVKVEP